MILYQIISLHDITQANTHYLGIICSFLSNMQEDLRNHIV